MQDKKAELAKLEAQNTNENKPTNWTPWIIGGGIALLVIGIIAYFLSRKKKE
ncbi:protein of unknown function [endosymbiont DhMRE of Dentiscutata heterogama]|uniref:GGIII-like transmembrane region-containing protein n=1 Tax=endosymbiont DhMRE of Dentiscutata heterogama TaxID=1609546 RepID=UPI000629D93E|nr:GGIII-like transmembrane region-containing protein [endosymbiont DhMRE of Dentiscutata heterogama]CFW93487.1 protein of unknown function [endosymbiont DhMRE of Dentiscutata heterogama]